jgi:AraC-like DNA-binding protein
MAAPTPGPAPELARWPRLAAAPAPQLRQSLPRGYAGYTEATRPRHLLLPASAMVPLVVKLADSPQRPPAFLLGASDTWTVPEGDCAPSYLELRLAPLAAYSLLGVPMDELSGQLVGLSDVLGPPGRRLAERLREAAGWRQRWALLDRWLLGRLAAGPRPAPEVGWAWRQLVASGGAVPIGHLARELGWSHKRLLARFRQQVGLRPKTAARLLRFEAMRRRLEAARRLDWARLAAEAGYADQAHLAREFRRFAGATPTAFAAGVNSVQDATGRQA